MSNLYNGGDEAISSATQEESAAIRATYLLLERTTYVRWWENSPPGILEEWRHVWDALTCTRSINLIGKEQLYKLLFLGIHLETVSLNYRAVVEVIDTFFAESCSENAPRPEQCFFLAKLAIALFHLNEHQRAMDILEKLLIDPDKIARESARRICQIGLFKYCEEQNPCDKIDENFLKATRLLVQAYCRNGLLKKLTSGINYADVSALLRQLDPL